MLLQSFKFYLEVFSVTLILQFCVYTNFWSSISLKYLVIKLIDYEVLSRYHFNYNFND